MNDLDWEADQRQRRAQAVELAMDMNSRQAHTKADRNAYMGAMRVVGTVGSDYKPCGEAERKA